MPSWSLNNYYGKYLCPGFSQIFLLSRMLPLMEHLCLFWVNHPYCVLCKTYAQTQRTLPGHKCGELCRSEKQRKPLHCASTSQQQLKCLCVTNITLATSLNNRKIGTELKKINSIPASKSTVKEFGCRLSNGCSCPVTEKRL